VKSNRRTWYKFTSSMMLKTLTNCCKSYWVVIFLGLSLSCSEDSSEPKTPVVPPPVTPVVSDVDIWLTTSNGGVLFTKQNASLVFKAQANTFPTIAVDTTQTFQTMDGFGYTLTGGSAEVIYNLPSDKRATLLTELFSTEGANIGISYLRISIGASDMSASAYTYNDLPSGQTDVDLTSFSLSAEQTHLIPLLKEILVINPQIKILGTPWSAPVWMKTNSSFTGGSLNPTYYEVYANYLVKYIQSMAAEGIVIDAITPQNEPLNPNNNPSMVMSSLEQTNFIKNNLGPAFATASLDTKIITYDHNCDVASYPLDVLADAGASSYVDGSAFHLYAGSISTLTYVHDTYPNKNVYFTEQYTATSGSFGGDLNWHLKNLIIGAPRNWSRNVLEWNLATDAAFGPHTPGGCTVCLGALTINSTTVTRNVSYYIVAHASKFVRPGTVRVSSNVPGSIQNVAFQRADGKKVLIVLNDSGSDQTFNIQFKGKIVTWSLQGGAVATFVW
jgi:glucosylceramidase